MSFKGVGIMKINKNLDLCWNVFKENVNSKKIEVFNIFNHYKFKESVIDILKNTENRIEFAEEIKSKLRYYYWAKCEWEVIITSWPCHVDLEEVKRINAEIEEAKEKYGRVNYRVSMAPSVGRKVDIYEQVLLNFDRFIDYLWEFKDSTK